MISVATCGEIKSKAFVGGKPKVLHYQKSHSQETLFPREQYFQKSGRILDILSCNRLRVDTGKIEEFVLIGLMDISEKFNPELRNTIINHMRSHYKGEHVLLYLPKDFQAQELEHNHAFAVSNDQLINAATLKDGMGIIPPSGKYSKILRSFLLKQMDSAVEGKLGIWKKY
jgi:hypothetical protein